MPCSNCGSEYGLLKREVGCENCSFSFCTKCCKKRELQLEKGKEKKLLCNKCFEIISSEKPNPNQISPPLAHKKRMENLKKQSFSVDSGSALKSEWSNIKDKEIAERLQRLKRERIKDDLPSEMEIEERLAKLKDMDPTKYKAPPIQVFRPSDKRTSIQQADDLMKQIKEEVNLDSQLVKPEDEIAARLARLKDEDPEKQVKSKVESDISVLNIPPSTACPNEDMDIDLVNKELHSEHINALNAASADLKELSKDDNVKKVLSNIQKEKESDDEIDEEEANKLVEKLMATNLDEEMEDLDSLQDNDKSAKSEESQEEFPWCVICTEDAKMRCFGCDSDLYCIRCFKECHDSLDIKDHKTCPYLSPKKSLI